MNVLSKRSLFFLLILLTLTSGAVGYYLFLVKKDSQNIVSDNKIISPCLKDNEMADYEIDRDKRLLKIIIKDKTTDKKSSSFEIDTVSKSYHGLELFKCNIYVIRVFNFDDENGIPLPNYKTELWQFSYDGIGKPLLTLFKKEGAIDNFGQDFRIDPVEDYIVLEQSYFGNPNYALIFKNLNNTQENAFILFYKDLITKYPKFQGSFGLEFWSKDGKYFWANLFEGANVDAFIRIEKDDWKVDLLSAPEDVLGGDALNVNTGYITVHPGNVWFGIAEFTQEEKEKRRKQGIGTELYIHNLFTGERQFVDETDEPLWYFKPLWISDIELEYTLPSGEKKIYKISD